MNNTNTRDRNLYDRVAKIAPKGTVPTLATLREEKSLVNNNGTYTFNFDGNRANVRPTETLLSITDSFYANCISLGILVERKTMPGSGVVLHYPCPHVVAQAGTSSAQQLEAVYNAILKAQIDTQVMVDKFSTRRFRHVPEGAGLVMDNYITGTVQSSFADGLVNVEPNLILRGTKKNIFTVTIPTFDAGATTNMAATDSAFDIRLVLELHGFIIPGGAGLSQ